MYQYLSLLPSLRERSLSMGKRFTPWTRWNMLYLFIFLRQWQAALSWALAYASALVWIIKEDKNIHSAIYAIPDYLKFLFLNLFPGFRDDLGCKSLPWTIRSSSHSSCVLALALNLGNFGSKGDISPSGRLGYVRYFVPFGGHSNSFSSPLLSFLPLQKRFRILETIHFPHAACYYLLSCNLHQLDWRLPSCCACKMVGDSYPLSIDQKAVLWAKDLRVWFIWQRRNRHHQSRVIAHSGFMWSMYHWIWWRWNCMVVIHLVAHRI